MSEQPAETTAVTPGAKTSEAKISVIAIIANTVLPAIYLTVDYLNQAQVIQTAWWPLIASMILGTLAAMGYQASRTKVKVAALNMQTAKALSLQNPQKPLDG